MKDTKQDVKDKIFLAYKRGKSTVEICKEFKISNTTARKYRPASTRRKQQKYE